jgi:hypothetical protein
MAMEQTFLDYFRMLAPQGVQSQKDSDYPGACWSLSPDAVLHGKVAATQGATSAAGFQGTFRREVAQLRPSMGFFTVGHPVFDAVAVSLETQPTGRAYAVECELAGTSPWRGFEFVFRAVPKLDEVLGAPALVSQACSLFTQRPIHVFVRDDGRIEEDHEWLFKARTNLTSQAKDRTWWNLTKDKAEGLRSAFGSKGWEGAVHEANSAAAARGHSVFARRVQPIVEAELARLAEIARQLRRSDAPDAVDEEKDVNRLSAAVRDWTVVLDAGGFLSINPGGRRVR